VNPGDRFWENYYSEAWTFCAECGLEIPAGGDPYCEDCREWRCEFCGQVVRGDHAECDGRCAACGTPLPGWDSRGVPYPKDKQGQRLCFECDAWIEERRHPADPESPRWPNIAGTLPDEIDF